MALRFRYKLEQAPQAVLSLGGRWVRPRPVIPVGVRGPAGTRAIDALLDTGVDDTVFPERFAGLLGIDLNTVPTGRSTGIGAPASLVRYAEATLRIVDGLEQREWTALVGFTAATMVYPVLGFAGFLQFFTATFHGDREEVELTINTLYPGT